VFSITLKEKALEQNRFQVKQFEEQNARFKTRVSFQMHFLVTFVTIFVLCVLVMAVE